MICVCCQILLPFFFFFSLDIEVCLEFGSDKLVNLELYCVRKKNNYSHLAKTKLIILILIGSEHRGMRSRTGLVMLKGLVVN